MQYTYNYEFTKNDYKEFYMYLTYNSPNRKKAWKKYYIKNSLICLIAFVLCLFSIKDLSYGTALPFVIGLLVILIGVFSAKAKHTKAANQVVENKYNENLFGKMQTSFFDEHIQIQTQFLNVTYQWQGIIKKEEDNNYIYLFINDMQAITLPKRCFSSKEEEDEFKKFLAKKTSFEADFG